MKTLPLAILTLATLPLLSQAKPAPTKPAIKQADHTIAPFTVWQLRPGDQVESQVTPTQLNPAGYWLLVYADLTAQPSKDLLTQLQTLASTSALDPTKLVIVADHATGAELSQFSLRYPALASAAWAHDNKHAAANLLNVHGTPHLFGMREGNQRWQLAGDLKLADLQPTLTTWLAYNKLPANTFTRTRHTRAEFLARAKPAPTQPQGPTP